MVERKNRTLEEMARTILIENLLAKHYCAEEVNTANYVLNRCLIRSILKKTPYELFKGRKPNIPYLRPFGCNCFIHNNGEDNLGMFDARSDEGIFLGYSLNSNAYRVLNKQTSMVEESIHVVFNESDNGILSERFKELNVNKHFDDVSADELDANDHNEDKKKNMQDPIQSLDEDEENRLSSLNTHSLILRPNLKTWKKLLNVLI